MTRDEPLANRPRLFYPCESVSHAWKKRFGHGWTRIHPDKGTTGPRRARRVSAIERVLQRHLDLAVIGRGAGNPAESARHERSAGVAKCGVVFAVLNA